jgi:hypothetical protein
VLYEGYILYPYWSTAIKNRQRWNSEGLSSAVFPLLRFRDAVQFRVGSAAPAISGVATIRSEIPVEPVRPRLSNAASRRKTSPLGKSRSWW